MSTMISCGKSASRNLVRRLSTTRSALPFVGIVPSGRNSIFLVTQTEKRCVDVTIPPRFGPRTKEVARTFSSSSEKKNGTNGTQQQEDVTSSEIVLTPGEKVVVGTRLAIWSAAGCFALGCGYYIFKELMPTKMGANTVFANATEVLKEDPIINRMYGDSANIKFYGRDHGGHREGRRNFIEHTEYKDPDDGTDRTRVRFNLEGTGGRSAFVFAEVSKDMPSGEFVYLMVQNKQGGRVHTVIDNRTILKAKAMGASNDSSDALNQLLGRSKK